MKRYILIVALVGILISACGSTSVQNTPVAFQTVTAIPNTNTPSPTQTRKPTPTLTPSPTIPPAIATVQKAQEACEDRAFYLDYALQRSPNEQWAAVVCETDNPITIISNITSDLEWIIPGDFYESYSGELWGPRLAVPYLWSKDGRHLYFSRHICCIDGPQLFFVEALFGLDRIDLDTGEIEDWYSGGSFSFSPDEHYFVYVEEEGNAVTIKDLFSGTRKTVRLSKIYQDVGLFAWSSDIAKLFFVTGTYEWWSGDDGFSLFLYDIEENKLTELISQSDKRYLAPVSSDDMKEFGVDNEHLVLYKLAFEEDSESYYWLLNIITGELEPYDVIIGE